MTLSQHSAGLTPAQRTVVDLIEREFLAAGLSSDLAAAAVVNAWHESRLNPKAVDPSGTQFGLFQLLTPGGQGQGMTRDELLDAGANTRRIIRTLKGSWGKPVLAAAEAGQGAAVLAGLFCKHIERPAKADQRALEREGKAYDLFPSLVAARPARTPGGVVVGGQGLAAQARGLTADQRAAAAVIEAEFLAAGLPFEFAAAAIVNAAAESALNPAAVYTEKDGSTSVGLFQLRDRGGLGTRYTVEERKDPVTNTRIIIEAVKGAPGKPMRDAWNLGERDVGRLTSYFCAYVERPADASAQGLRRRALSVRMFPDLFDLRRLVSDPYLKNSPLLPVVLTAGFGAVGYLAWRLSHPHRRRSGRSN